MSSCELLDITEVCKMFKITSRTLRLYEEKGIIQSTTTPFSKRRKYSKNQINIIKDVLVLLTLGLSLKVIAELQNKEGSLRDAIIAKRNEIYAQIDSKSHELSRLNEAIQILDTGNNIFEKARNKNELKLEQMEAIVTNCSSAIINDSPSLLYQHLSSTLKEYMPLEVYKRMRFDTLSPLGEFISYESIKQDDEYKNIVYHYLRYQNLGLKIKYVFHGDLICGLWLGYYE